MQSQHMFASAMFACRNPSLAEPSHFGALLEAVTSAVAPMPLSHRFTVLSSGAIGRGKLLQDRGEIARLWSRRATSELYLSSLAPDAYIGSDPYAQVTFGRHPVPYKRPSAENFLQSVSLTRSLGASDTDLFLSGLRQLFVLLDAPSGYIHVSTEQTLARGELGFQAMTTFMPPPARRPDGAVDPDAARDWLNWKHAEDTNDRIRKLAEVRSLVGPRLRGTYWGTFLGREMVDELGGERRVTSEAPVAMVESLDGGGMYLQLTPTPEPITSPAMQRGLVALERFLEPVLVPIPLYFATRSFTP